MGDFLQVCPKRLCISTVGKRTDLFARDPYKTPITDFFGSVRSVEITSDIIELPHSIMNSLNATKNDFKRTNVIKQDTCGQMNTKSHCDAKDKTKPVYEWSHPLPIVETV